jgi:two-component system heavy metal sensor histidine kinase CusS
MTGSDRSFRLLAVRSAGRTPGTSHGVIQVAMDRSLEVELLAEYRKHLWIVLGASLVLCSVVGYRIARRGIRPIDEIVRTTYRIHPSNLGERIAADGLPAELLTLVGTFNEMLDRLEQSFVRLSRFSADIAHELRTPVNNLRGEVEVALGKPRSPEDYRDVLGSALEECGRLSRIIDSLLFLARAEDPHMQVASERIDLRSELSAICEFYEASAAEAGVRLSAAVEGIVQADLNRPLFQRAVGNLVDNAVAWTPPGGFVTMAASGDLATIKVEVADTGFGISATHLPYVFDRFYRADQARSSAGGGVGLGLAIVRSIAEVHGGTVEITSAVGLGTRVAMCFPRRGGKCPTEGTKMTET